MQTFRVLLAAAFATGLLAACKSASPVSADTHESPRATLFPHDKHGGFDCVDCHTGIPSSTKLGEATPPGIAKCEECHPDVRKPADESTRKVADVVASLERREPRDYQISINHAEHLSRIKTKEANDACRTCHKDEQLPQEGVTRSTSPQMQACTACHYHTQEVAEARCTPCHVSLRRYPLKPIEALAGFSHRGNFVREHGRLAKNTAETCAQCHDQTYCAKCHANATVPFRAEIQFPEKVETDFIHRGDYVSRHQIEAAADPSSCRKCHGSFFCDSCHTQQNISHRNSVAGGTPHNPHPQGWGTDRSAGVNFHGTAARQNILLCAGCHDQAGPANLCVSCHQVGGFANVNPHPPSFLSKHTHSDIRKNGMCIACHKTG